MSWSGSPPLAFTTYDINVGGYAVVGAAALSGASTRTISTAVIALELTGQLYYMLPCFLSVLTAVAVSRRVADGEPPLSLRSFPLSTRNQISVRKFTALC